MTKRAVKTASAKKPAKAPRKASERTRAKATYAYEPHPPTKRPSRKSTRGGANRAKSGSTIDIREELAYSSPTSRARQAKVARTRVRGAGR